MAISIKTPQDIEILRRGGKRLARVLAEVATAAKPGVSTAALDEIAARHIAALGGRSSFKGYCIKEVSLSYPGSICTSVNDEVVHGIPSPRRMLQDGDVLGIDIGMQWPAFAKASAGRPAAGGLFTDTAVTVAIGTVSHEAAHLLRSTKEALMVGIRAVRAGVRVGDVSFAIEAHLKAEGLGRGIIRDLAGHGVGYKVHEEPLVPNFGESGTGPILKEGMVLAIEPMTALGHGALELDDDQWTFRTADKSLAAHFEHTIVVTADGAEILTAP